MSLSTSYTLSALVLLAMLAGVSNSQVEPTTTDPELPRITVVDESHKFLGVDESGSATYEVKHRLEDFVFTGDSATYTGGDKGFSTLATSVTPVPQFTLEVNAENENEDVRTLGLNEEVEGEGQGEGAGGEKNGDESGNGGEDEQGSAPALGASRGLAFATDTLASGSALLFL
ncbi:hypothetical protein BDV98DRAFT_627169 [Pterulicium gracile]|uniref:Uncharacterized protein n=1 Tax=Pterulicium gracile TaxID=1884261 RepID=A0A5C3QA02_9AGAR|nr:hypothetical protein BDV98DRAFT_627169 [Pterula gracilis]